jgi:hypothetical protein
MMKIKDFKHERPQVIKDAMDNRMFIADPF